MRTTKVKKMLIISTLLVVVFVLFIAALLFAYDRALFFLNDRDLNYLEIDKCLDSGGSWNYDTENCETE